MPARFPHTLSTAAVFVLLVASSASASDTAQPGSIPGLDFEAELILDSVTLLDGGAGDSSSSAMLGKTALTFDFDTGKARLWKGGRALVQILGTFGDEPSSLTGDLQVFDNIEAGNDFGILEAWLEQSLGTKASILVGYHDLNREFDVIESAGELLHSSFGIGPEISQIGPSLFPKTHPGARLEIRPTDGTYVKIAAYDGLTCDVSDGSYYAVETGWHRDRLGSLQSVKVAFGAWHLDREARSFDLASDADGGYLLAEATYETAAGKSVGLFVRAGASNNELQPIQRYTGIGARLGRFITSRPDDVVSLGIARADIGSDHRVAGSPATETTVEITWLAQITSWLAIQPDIQYIDSPAAGTGITHALVGGVRLILTY